MKKNNELFNYLIHQISCEIDFLNILFSTGVEISKSGKTFLEKKKIINEKYKLAELSIIQLIKKMDTKLNQYKLNKNEQHLIFNKIIVLNNIQNQYNQLQEKYNLEICDIQLVNWYYKTVIEIK